MKKKTDFTSLKDYFLLGDLHSAALLSRNGSIDWLCWPHFDSPSVFAKLLDAKGGSFSVEMEGFSASASYRKDTAIVDTKFSKGRQSFTVTDFMVPQIQDGDVTHLLVRKFGDASAKLTVTLLFHPRMDYARKSCSFKREGSSIYTMIGGKRMILHMPSHSKVEHRRSGGSLIRFTLRPGETKTFALEYHKKEDYSYDGEDFEKWVEKFWRSWVKTGTYTRFCRSKLVRSAITLKLMQFYPSGGLIAAPTTSLPESIGGERNWDYRYVWVRDATLILYGLQLLGHTEEAVRFFRYIERVTKACDSSDIHIKLMYAIDGSSVPKEELLDHLEGYRGSKPVRVGNGAKDQFQLDVYGSVIDAYYFMSKRGILPSPPSKALMLHLVERIEELWEEPDAGIWEVREFEHRFTYSRIMAWVGIDRLLQMKEELDLSAEKVRHYEVLLGKIADWIWENCFDAQRKVFRQHPNTPAQDATNFLFVMMRFLDRDDPLTKEIIENTAKELVEDEIFAYRYKNDDGFASKEGSFTLCSYWYISALASVGEAKKARRLFTKLEKHFSPTGLISEEISPETGDYLGNFPQAFSHIGYIMAAHHIEKYSERKPSKKK